MNKWTYQDSAQLYGVDQWGAGFFGVNSSGSIQVTPNGSDQPGIDLNRLIEDLKQRGIKLPVLLRFEGILERRVREINESFGEAIRSHAYRGTYRSVYPIKVNQQRQVVQTLMAAGREFGMGLEVGSKPELLAVVAMHDVPDALCICNGYKDDAYIEIALLSTRLGRHPIIVVEKFSELDTIMRVSKRVGIRPRIGLRAKLATRGAGRWEASGGDRSKFGLDANELVAAVEKLRGEAMLDCVELLHFHLGSQITSISTIKKAITEGARLFVELHRLGAKARFLDVGGGLGVDYDGSRTTFDSSMNYSLQEYANDVVWLIQETCDSAEIPHPDIISESGRALVAHHAALVMNVLGVSRLVDRAFQLDDGDEDEDDLARSLREVVRGITRKNYQEAFHDLVQLRDEVLTRFNLGLVDLKTRAVADEVYWLGCREILKITRELTYVPDDLSGLEKHLSDTYFCNFSVFQSLPDHWAIQHVFPVVPIHRLNQQPTRFGVLGDITCDSDGKMDRFIDLRDVKPYLELHDVAPGEDYHLGVFLVGAYQEILGDLHNLFGDTNAVHVAVDEQGRYRLTAMIEGDRIDEVLSYVQIHATELSTALRSAAERAVEDERMSFEESGRLLRRYDQALRSYTYLES